MRKLTFRFAAVISAITLTACASTPRPAPVEAQVKIQYIGPRNDINSGQDQINGTTFIQRASAGQATLGQGLMYAVFCNDAHTACKHAVTFETMEITVSRLDDGQVRVKGTVESQIGRRLSHEEDSGTFKTRHESAIPNGVPVLDERTTTSSFDRTARIGDRFSLSGLAGSRYDFTVEPAEQTFWPKK